MIREVPTLLMSLLLLVGIWTQSCPVPEGLSSPVLIFHEHIEALHKRLSSTSKNDAINLVHFTQKTMNDIIGFVAIFQMRNDVEKTESFVGFLTTQRRAGSVTGIPYSIVKYAQSESLFEIQSFLGVKDERVTKYECSDLKGKFEKGLTSDPALIVAPLPVKKKQPIFNVDSFMDTRDSFVNLDDDLEEEIKPKASSIQSKNESLNDKKSVVSSNTEVTPLKSSHPSQSLNGVSGNGGLSTTNKLDDQNRQVLPVISVDQLSRSVPTEVVVNMRTFAQPSTTIVPTPAINSASNLASSQKPKESLLISTEIRNDNNSSAPLVNPQSKSTAQSSATESSHQTVSSSGKSSSSESSSRSKSSEVSVNGKESQSKPSTTSLIDSVSNKTSTKTENSAKSEDDNSLNFNYDYIRDLYEKYAHLIDEDDSKSKEVKTTKEESTESSAANSSTKTESLSSSSLKSSFSQSPVQQSVNSQTFESNRPSLNSATSTNTYSASTSRSNNNKIDTRDSTPSSLSYQTNSSSMLSGSSSISSSSTGFKQENSSSNYLSNSIPATNQNFNNMNDSAKESSLKPTGRYPTYSELYGDFSNSIPTIQESLNAPKQNRHQTNSPPSITPNTNNSSSSSDVSYDKLIELLRKTQETEAQQVELIKKLKDETEFIQKLHLILSYIRRQEDSGPKNVSTGKVRPTEFLFNNRSQNNNSGVGQRFDGLNLGSELNQYAAMNSADLLRVITQKERFVSLLTNLLVSNYQFPSKAPQSNLPPSLSNNVIYGPVNSFSNMLVDGRGGRIVPLEQTKAVRITQSIPN